MIYDYKKDKKKVDALIMPHLPNLYEQCIPIFTKLLEHYWLNNPDIAQNKMQIYRSFSNSSFADNIFKKYFFDAFVVGWKQGYFSLVQVVNYEKLLEKDLEKIGEQMMVEAEKCYSFKIAVQMLILLETVRDIGIKSGKQTTMTGR